MTCHWRVRRVAWRFTWRVTWFKGIFMSLQLLVDQLFIGSFSQASKCLKDATRSFIFTQRVRGLLFWNEPHPDGWYLNEERYWLLILYFNVEVLCWSEKLSDFCFYLRQTINYISEPFFSSLFSYSCARSDMNSGWSYLNSGHMMHSVTVLITQSVITLIVNQSINLRLRCKTNDFRIISEQLDQKIRRQWIYY